MAWKKKFKSVKTITTQIEGSVKDRLIEIAELEDRDMASQIRYFVKQGIKRYEEKKQWDKKSLA